jgi:hypothetical protein
MVFHHAFMFRHACGFVRESVRILRELVAKDRTFPYACNLFTDLVSRRNIKQNAPNEQLQNETDILCRNMDNKLPTYAA